MNTEKLLIAVLLGLAANAFMNLIFNTDDVLSKRLDFIENKNTSSSEISD